MRFYLAFFLVLCLPWPCVSSDGTKWYKITAEQKQALERRLNDQIMLLTEASKALAVSENKRKEAEAQLRTAEAKSEEALKAWEESERQTERLEKDLKESKSSQEKALESLETLNRERMTENLTWGGIGLGLGALGGFFLSLLIK